MSTIFWHETNMTSNTTPVPLVASASSVYPSNVAPWRAFNGTTVDNQDAWASANGITDASITLDYGRERLVDRVRITSVNGAVTFGTKNFEIFGSNDNTNWTLMASKLDIPIWGKAETREYVFNKKDSFRYYKLRTWGTYQSTENYVGIGNLQYGFSANLSLTLKSSTTNEHYSLSDNTLIHLPDNSIKNMILHGIEQGKEIQLDVPFDKHIYVDDTPVANVSGKLFAQDIGIVNTLSIKEVNKDNDFKPIYTWHNTNMTSDTSPVPLIAKSSGIFNSTYPAWKAFNGTTINADDGWVSSNKTGWIEINYGKNILVNILNLSHRNTSTLTSAPKNFIIEGSNNGTAYETLATISNETNWLSVETRQFVFNNIKTYSYYRINVSENNGHATELSIGDILFGYKREV
ncbi:hypothetical protein ABIA69_002191 [Lysinibacillus parviboronicapiens]|uniref:F5/8 type C domain-containing protein n=1 Tax=Lysinibacillus parviboronicapiens TaxID=436516 RepID=A0ABV2PJC0_9BACI